MIIEVRDNIEHLEKRYKFPLLRRGEPRVSMPLGELIDELRHVEEVRQAKINASMRKAPE